MIDNFFTKSVTVNRMSKNPTTGFLEMNAVYTNVPCAIQSAEVDQQFDGEGGFNKRFNFWCATTYTIESGDEIVDGDTTYSVEGASVEAGITGENDHVHAYLNLSQNA